MRPLLPLLLPLLLAACVSSGPTPYRPVTSDSAYGFHETKIDDTTYRIEVAGNRRTSRALVENQLLYRAAELATAQGADGFVILERDVEAEVRQRGVAYDPFFYPYGTFWWGRFPHYGLGLLYAPPVFIEQRPDTTYTAFAEVRFFTGTAPSGLGPSYQAAEVLKNLKDKVNLPTP